MNSGNCAEFPVAPPASLAHDARHESGKIRESSGQAAKRGDCGRAAELSPRTRADQGAASGPVAGCDEAGRGPLAGPVVAAAVVLDPKRIPRGIDDSKRLTPERRGEFVRGNLPDRPRLPWLSRRRRESIATTSCGRSLWALARAVHALPETPRHVFVDGRDPLDVPCDCDAVIGGRRAGGLDRGGVDHRQGDPRPA